jgi:hypothetical protein
MNTNDHPDLTAYALGELEAEHAEAMARWIAENPQAQAEADGLTELTHHLKATAPIAVATLHPHQRDAVLNGPQRVRQLVAAAQQKPQRKSMLMPVLRNVARLAAAAAMLLIGYQAGSHFNKSQASTDLATANPEPAAPKAPATAQPAPMKMEPFKAVEVVKAPPAPEPATIAAPASLKPEPIVVAVVEKLAPAPSTVPVVAAKVTSLMPVAKEPTPAAKAPAVIHRLVSSAFINTARDSQTEVILRPAETRPAPAPTGPVAAAPIRSDAKAAAQPLSKPKQADLRLHSWKAEVASCPWDESRRLVRLVVQIPGEQPAAAPGNEYALRVGFDPKYVRSFRPLGERSMPAVAADAPAFHIAWYEFVPNGQPADTARVIGSVKLPNAQFTTVTTAPFDSSTLQVVDRGTAWASARDDFLFESAVMGFGLLLKGDKDCGSLNHELVLDLAQRAGDADRDNERAKFTRLVKEAGRATGL